MSPRFSIVIPLYEKAASIRNTLNSVLQQTYKNYELILVDDGSTDQSVAIATELLNNTYVEFEIIHKSNGGVSSARNTGIKAAKYEYISFLDADDYWMPQYLDEVVLLINQCADAGIYGIGWDLMSSGQPDNTQSDDVTVSRGYLDNPWSREKSYFTSSTTLRADVLQQVGGFDERISRGEDIDLWYRVLLKYRGAYSNRLLAYYVQDSENRLFLTEVPFEKHYICYFTKWTEARTQNEQFRLFFDCNVASALCFYLEKARLFTDSQYRNQLLQIRKLLDPNALSLKMRIRLYVPHVYMLIRRFKGKITFNV